MNTLPSQVVILGYTYELNVDSRIDHDRNGECDTDNLVIRLNPNCHPKMRAEILWHEINHAIYDYFDLDDESKEEDFTTRGSRGQLQVLADNPWLFGILQTQHVPFPQDKEVAQ